ncbi:MULTISPECIES: hypothetical protein [unclassified Pseudomonas]|jgi:hypothetical protein|uniref:hypothetical protein n=1 Tax=unclassified Pseudomonas TaxID=196821 RepID=UPI001CF96B92|nr:MULTISPECIES: hypothetical protein [unclassified Pseudomonas]WLH79818.1 hypothetical protein PSH81_02280 [Pseudomonas sp. FP2335]
MSIEYILNLPAKDQIALGSAASMLLAVALDIFLAYRKLESMEQRLDQCSLLDNYKHLWGNSLRGRLTRLCAVYVAIALPKWNTRRGVINAKQVAEFPRCLKFALHGTALIGLVGAVGAMFFHFSDQPSL